MPDWDKGRKDSIESENESCQISRVDSSSGIGSDISVTLLTEHSHLSCVCQQSQRSVICLSAVTKISHVSVSSHKGQSHVCQQS